MKKKQKEDEKKICMYGNKKKIRKESSGKGEIYIFACKANSVLYSSCVYIFVCRNRNNFPLYAIFYFSSFLLLF